MIQDTLINFNLSFSLSVDLKSQRAEYRKILKYFNMFLALSCNRLIGMFAVYTRY